MAIRGVIRALMVHRHLVAVVYAILLNAKLISCMNASCPILSYFQDYELSVHSQNGEDGILIALLGAIGHTNKYYVEFGVEDGQQCNTRLLRERYNFTGLLMDGSDEIESINLHKEFILVDNIVELFQKHHVPTTFDVLSIDLDMFDFWILAEILNKGRYRPRIIVVEVNPTLGARSLKHDFHESNSHPLSVPHPHTMNQTMWDMTRYFGANPRAFQVLGGLFGYEMVYCETCGVNCFLVLRSELSDIPACTGALPLPLPFVPYPCYHYGDHSEAGHPPDPASRLPVRVSESFVRSYLRDGPPEDIHAAMERITHRRAAPPMSEQVERDREVEVDESGGVRALSEGPLPLYCPLEESNTAKALQNNAICACFCSSCRDSIELDAFDEAFRSDYEDYLSRQQQEQQTHRQQTAEDNLLGYGTYCRELDSLDGERRVALSPFLPDRDSGIGVCTHIAALFYQRTLHHLSVGNAEAAEAAARRGLLYKASHAVLTSILEHFQMASRLATSITRYSISQQYLLDGHRMPVLGVFGLGVCDSIATVATKARQLWSLNANGFDAMSRNLRRGLLDSIFWGMTDHVMPRQFLEEPPGEDRGSVFEALVEYVPPCLRSVYQPVEDIVQSMCSRRRNAVSVMVLGPPYSGAAHIYDHLMNTFDSRNVAWFRAQHDINREARSINMQLLDIAGCRSVLSPSGRLDFSALLPCQSQLRELGKGLFANASALAPESASVSASGTIRLKSLVFEDMYRLRMQALDSGTVLLSDDLFSLTSPHWASPLGGKTAVFISVTEPRDAIKCLLLSSSQSPLTHDEAVDVWWLYLRSAIRTLLYMDEVYVTVQHSKKRITMPSTLLELLAQGYPNATTAEESSSSMDIFSPCAELEERNDGATQSNVPDIVVPQHMLDCYAALITLGTNVLELCV